MVKEHNGSFVIAVTLRDEENVEAPAAEEWYAALFSGTSQTLSAICRMFQPRMTLQTTGVVCCRARTQLSCGANAREETECSRCAVYDGYRGPVYRKRCLQQFRYFLFCVSLLQSRTFKFLPFLTGALQLRYLSLFSLFCSGCPNTS